MRAVPEIVMPINQSSFVYYRYDRTHTSEYTTSEYTTIYP